jgi:hypothetical protein
VSTVQKNVKSRVSSKVLFTDEIPPGGCFMNLNSVKQTKHNKRITVLPKNQFLKETSY